MRKLYLKIVAAIWVVMLASATGVALVAHVVMPPDAGYRVRVRPPENLLESIAERAATAARGGGQEALIEWFEGNLVLRGGPAPLTLVDRSGNVLAGRPLSVADLRALSRPDRQNAEAGLQQRVFSHDGELYRIVAPGRQRMIDIGGPALKRSFPGSMLIALRPPSFWIALLIAIPLSVILSFGIARYLVRPLRSIEQAGRRLSEGDLSARVGPSLGNRGDEIADFAAAFDRMATRIETLVRSHKDLLRDVSHELRSPLARAHAALSLARQRTSGIVDSELDRLEVEVERLDAMIGRLLAFSRLDSGERPILHEAVDLVGLLTEIAQDAEFEAESNGKAVSLQQREPLTVRGDPELLASCFENIVRNAVRHTHEGTGVVISVSCNDDFCRVDIRDHGDGVPDDELQKIFDPFHRVGDSASPDSNRSGIGLAIATRAVELHGGRIFAANASDRGLIVTVILPLRRKRD